jgi:hypothetical protein
MCVIVKNMLFLGTKILHFRERIFLLQKLYFQRIWRIMLFLYLYQIYIIQFWASKWSCVWNVMPFRPLSFVVSVETCDPRVGYKENITWFTTVSHSEFHSYVDWKMGYDYYPIQMYFPQEYHIIIHRRYMLCRQR